MDFDWKAFESEFNLEFQKISQRLQGNFKKLYVSRVNPDLVSGITVQAYGSDMKLDELSNISIPAARTIIIKPYDISVMDDIVKGLQKSRPEFSPQVQSDHIRISLNPPTEETRKKSVKEAKEFLEQSKISLRNVRKDMISKIKNADLSEDLEKKYSNQLDSLIKHFNNQLDQEFSHKEKELMTL